MVDTLKTSVVVVLLLAGLYCVYVVLNKPDQSTQDLAWEAGAADPALEIELGVPEPGGADVAESSTPTSIWGATPPALGSTYDPRAHSTDAGMGTAESSPASPNPDVYALGTRPSLPIPEATTPAAPAIAAPDLINDVPSSLGAPAGDELQQGSLALPIKAAAPAVSNALRDSTGGSNGGEAPANRYGESNRYSDYSPLRSEPTSDAQIPASGDAQPPANSAQANVNDSAVARTPGSGANEFQAAIESAHTKIQAEAWKDALIKLSSHYDEPGLSASEAAELVDLLDPLAGKVIYSTEHLIEPPYRSQAGDTLMNIADRYQVPWQLLANINGIENPETSLAGRELKVVRGPFRAEVSLSKSELTLFVGKLYAGRFPVTVGSAPAPLPGQYQVNDKQPGRTYYAGNGATIPIDDPNNPYGRVWLDLGNNLCIHGSSPNGVSPGQGCLALTARDAGDLYGILSKGSSIVIKQ